MEDLNYNLILQNFRRKIVQLLVEVLRLSVPMFHTSLSAVVRRGACHHLAACGVRLTREINMRNAIPHPITWTRDMPKSFTKARSRVAVSVSV